MIASLRPAGERRRYGTVALAVVLAAVVVLGVTGLRIESEWMNAVHHDLLQGVSAAK